jgi:phenylacetate-coenzyme A ligase PaaK-like adenylate-forming protein
MKKTHLCHGKLTDNFVTDDIFESIRACLGKSLPTEILFEASEKLFCALENGDVDLEKSLVETGMDSDEAHKSVCGLAGVFSKTYLEDKLEHELGSITPFVPRRFNMEQNVLECYKPLGVLCHVAAGNSPGMGALSVLEGLLTGNINIVKLSGKENGFSAILLHKLVSFDSSGTIAQYVYALDIPSADTETLNKLFEFSTAIVAWGSIDAIDSIRASTKTPVIAWGHHISFAYLTKAGAAIEANIVGIAHDICAENQQACASPQCLYYEGGYDELAELAQRLKAALVKVSPEYAVAPIGIHEQAQITSQNIMATLGSCMDEGDLVEDPNGNFRIYINRSPALMPSPLFRTIWLKPMQRNELVKYIMPMSRFMQTVSLGCILDEVYELTELLFSCGATRIVSPGNVFASYAGEPHDGVFALTKYCKRVAIQIDKLEKIASLEQLAPHKQKQISGKPIMDKDAFMAIPPNDLISKLYVKSGGSSGKTILSSYSYRDYHFEMRALAESLIGIGLEPKTDRVINLLSAGHLYGGFISYGCILELANAKNFPMAEIAESGDAARAIVDLNINTVMGMPSYLLKVFRENETILAKYKGIKKVFYGGEFISAENKDYLRKTFDVEIIASMGYGSNDVGPIGYACEYCTDGVHHLLSGIMDMEIIKQDKDEPVEKGETGRILLSPKFREGHSAVRYEIGDLGRWIEGDCLCGRKNPRFELMGRYGDMVRVGGCFLNYKKLSGIISSKLENTQMQMIIEGGSIERITFCVGNVHFTTNDLIECLKKNDAAIAESLDYKYIDIVLKKMNEGDMQYTETSGKLKHIIDLR